MTDINPIDEIFLSYARERNFVFDIENGKIYDSLGDEVGCKSLKAVTISVRKDQIGYGITRARAIWLHVHGSIPLGYGVSHKSTNLWDDSISNLELLTVAERSKKSVYNRDVMVNFRTTSCKLTLENVNEARILARDPINSYQMLAEKYGVSRHTIIAAIKGESWKHATVPPTPIRPGTWTRGQKKTPDQIYPRKKPRAPKPPKAPRIRREREKKVVVKKIVVKPFEDVMRVTKSLLKNNSTLSNNGIMTFLRMRRLADGLSERKLSAIARKIRQDITQPAH
jgi:hypothetical protein